MLFVETQSQRILELKHQDLRSHGEPYFTSYKHIICETPLRPFLRVFIRRESSSHFRLFPLTLDLPKNIFLDGLFHLVSTDWDILPGQRTGLDGIFSLPRGRQWIVYSGIKMIDRGPVTMACP